MRPGQQSFPFCFRKGVVQRWVCQLAAWHCCRLNQPVLRVVVGHDTCVSCQNPGLPVASIPGTAKRTKLVEAVLSPSLLAAVPCLIKSLQELDTQSVPRGLFLPDYMDLHHPVFSSPLLYKLNCLKLPVPCSSCRIPWCLCIKYLLQDSLLRH